MNTNEEDKTHDAINRTKDELNEVGHLFLLICYNNRKRKNMRKKKMREEPTLKAIMNMNKVSYLYL